MPIYEYRCPKCGEFEVTQRITESPPKKCPTCKAKVTKLISNTSFQLKGSGWYVTDYGRSGAASKSDSKADGKGESKAESKTESKTESKSSDSKSSETKTSKSESKAA